MALTLIKEDGTGKPDANTYADAADADAYFAGHLYASAWTVATNDQKATALAMATRLAGSFILGMEQRLGGGFVARAQAFLLAVLRVLGIVNAIAAIQTEQLFHNITFLSIMLLRRTFLRN